MIQNRYSFDDVNKEGSKDKALDSKEELYATWMFDELIERRYLKNYIMQPKSFILNKPAVASNIKKMKRVPDKVLPVTLIPQKVYTPDCKLIWELEEYRGTNLEKLFPIIPADINRMEIFSILEIKGKFDRGNMTRLANSNIAFVWEKYIQYIQLIKIPNFFNKGFTPERYLLTDLTLKGRTISYKTRTLEEFLSLENFKIKR